MTAPILTPDQEAALLASARAALRAPVVDDLATIDAQWPTAAATASSPAPPAAGAPASVRPVPPPAVTPPPLPALEPLAVELVAAHRERLALAAAVVAAQQALEAAVAREAYLRPRVEAALAFARQDRVVIDGGVISLVSARVRRGDAEGTVVARSGLRVRLRSPRDTGADEPLFARAPRDCH